MIVSLVVFPAVVVVWALMHHARFRDNYVGKPPSKLAVAARRMSVVLRANTAAFAGAMGVASRQAVEAMRKLHAAQAKVAPASSVVAERLQGIPIHAVDGLPDDTVLLVDRGKLAELPQARLVTPRDLYGTRPYRKPEQP